jgi:hypothetical protein
MVEKTNHPRAIFPFQDVFDRELRNAIFHSDYDVYMGEVRIPKGFGMVYTHENYLSLINKALAYFETFNTLIYGHIFSYQLPKVISPHPEMSGDPELKFTTIIRKGYGLVGLKDNWTKEDLYKGKTRYVVGNYLKYEIKMINENPFITVLPKNRIEPVNRVLRILPYFIRTKIVGMVGKKGWF